MDLDVMGGVWFQGSLRLFWGWSWTAALDERLGANKSDLKPGVVAHAFSPSTREAEAGGFLASLVYKVSSRTAKAIQRNPVSKNKTKQKQKQNKSDLKTQYRLKIKGLFW
jgi:hypothetical protein